MKPFQENQLAFTEYLRGTESNEKTDEQKPRQQQIYRDLVYKNINQCIADVFPITKNIITEADWEILMREFISVHRLQTPYFLEICQEFLTYLAYQRKPLATVHPFMLELAHFEWIQLALDTADICFPEHQHNSTSAESTFSESSLWKASPLAVGLTYSYPVHIIDECYLPKEGSIHPNYLLIYRNRNDDVKILVTDDLSLRIIQLLQSNENINHIQIRELLSAELEDDQKDIIAPRILPILRTLAESEIVFCK
jgi:uncharacterized protein